MGKTRATLDSKWNPKRRAITYRIGKKGTNAFLLLSAEDLPGLYEMLGEFVEDPCRSRLRDTEKVLAALVAELDSHRVSDMSWWDAFRVERPKVPVVSA